MKRSLLSVFCLFAWQLACAQVDTARVGAIVRQQAAGKNFEGTVLIADKGKVVHQSVYGYQDRDRKTKTQAHSPFSIASITKMLTAIVVLQLQEEGKLSLQDKVAPLLPAFTFPQPDSVTVHHLLLHISGLPSEDDAQYTKAFPPAQMIQTALQSRTPGRAVGRYHYNNLDYLLLGLLIEKKTGTTWQQAIQTRIIDKLRLTNTGFLVKGKEPKNFVFSFSTSKDGTLAPDPAWHIENYYAAGGMYSTAQDLLAIDQALYGNTLLSQKSKELMFTSYPAYNYTGYSVWTYTYPFAETKPTIMERRGGIKGATSALVRLLDSNRTIIILSNNDRFNPDSFGDKDNLREALIIELGKAAQKQ